MADLRPARRTAAGQRKAAEHRGVAADAFAAYGKGRHKASLNFGDCLTYAVAKVADRPLLFKGDDFPHTDLDLVITST